MKCPKCGSKMIPERIMTPDGNIFQARCIFCGTYIDRLTLVNRQTSLRMTKIDRLFRPRVILK